MRVVRSHVSGKSMVLAALAAGLLFAHSAALAADAARGKVLFTQKYGCYQCHGDAGQGAVTGPKLAPNPLPYEALSTFVRTTNRQMPPFKEAVLPEADLQDMYAYLQSIPPSADWHSIPLLNND